jgi:hypothetical protein
VRSLRDWWRGQRRPLSARGHLYGIAFLIVIVGLAIYRMLAAERNLTGDVLFLAAVTANLALLLLSCRNVLRANRARSPEGDDEGMDGAT